MCWPKVQDRASRFSIQNILQLKEIPTKARVNLMYILLEICLVSSMFMFELGKVLLICMGSYSCIALSACILFLLKWLGTNLSTNLSTCFGEIQICQ